MGSVQNSVYYCCVSKGDRILYAYNGGDDEIEKLAILCLGKAPSYHRWYFQTMGRRTYGFLMEEGFVYFAIADSGIGKPGLLRFLEHIRDEFNKMNKGLRKSLSNLDSLCLQEKLVPVIYRLISRLEQVAETSAECPIETPSPPGQSDNVSLTKAPLLGKSSKIEKKKMKEHAIAMREIQLEEHRKSADRVINSDLENSASLKRDASASSVAIQKDFVRMRSSNSNMRKKWCRQVRIILAIDVVVCLLLFVIWLLVCDGTRCL